MTTPLAPLVALALAAAPIGSAARADAWDGPDKRAHLVASAGIAATGSVLAHALDLDATDRALIGFGVGVTAGALKEGLDALGLGAASAPDFVWSAAGAALGAALTWVLSALVE